MQHFALLSVLVAIFVSTDAAKPRSINVALETVLEFDNSSDADFIDQVQDILRKVKNVIKNNPIQNVRKSTKPSKRYRFTNFLEDIFVTLFAFNDKDLMEIIQIIDSELRRNIQTNALQANVRRYLTNELDHIKTKPAKTIRKSLDKLLRQVQNARNGKSKNNFLGFINTLYKRGAEEKLAKFVGNLKIFRRSSQKSKKDSIGRAVKFVIFENFSNLSENTKRMAEARIKDYLRDNFTTAHSDKKYSHIHDQPNNVTLAPVLVLQNSEDTETSKETIDIEERNFKPKLNIKKQHWLQDRSDESELSTKTFAKNETVKHKKKSERVLAKKLYKINNLPQITFKQPKSGYNQKIRTINKKYNKMHSNKKHLSYPGNIKMEKRNLKVSFKSTILVTLNKVKIDQTKKNKTLDDGMITSIINHPDTNVNSKNNKIHFVSDDNQDLKKRKDALMKVRAFRKELMERRRNREESATHKRSGEYFGSLFKNKGMTVEQIGSRPFVGSNIDDAYRIREFLNEIENVTKTTNLRNNKYKKKKELNFPENKSHKKLKTIDLSKEYDRTNKIEYRGTKGANIEENKPNITFKTIQIHENYSELPQETHIDENNSRQFIKRNDIVTENNEKLAEFKFIKNKTGSILKKIKITTESNNIVNNRGFKRIKEPKIIDKISMAVSTPNNINVASNMNTDNELIIENDLESTTNKLLNTYRRLMHVTSYTKSDKVINEVEERVGSHEINSNNNFKKDSKPTKQIIESISTHRNPKTNQPEEETIKFTNKVTKSDDFSENINKTNPLIRSKHTNAKIQSDSKINRKNIELRVDLKQNNNKLQDLKRKLDLNASIIIKTDKDSKLEGSTDTVKKQNTKMLLDQGKTNLNQEITTISYNKDIKPNNYNKHQYLDLKVTKHENLNTELHNEIKTTITAVDSISSPNSIKEINKKHIRSNNTNINDSRRQFAMNPKTSTINRDKKLENTTLHEVKTTEIDFSLDIKKYLQNPEVTDVEDNQKKKEIEQKIQEDLGKLLTLPATNATTTVAYTDIFEVMENDFDLGPLK